MSEAPYWTVPHLYKRKRSLLIGVVCGGDQGYLEASSGSHYMSFSQVLVEEFLHPDIEYFLVLYGLYGHELGRILLV